MKDSTSSTGPEVDRRFIGESRLAAHYEKVLRSICELYEQDGPFLWRALEIFDMERLNIATGQGWSARHAATSEQAAILSIDYMDAGVGLLELRLLPAEHISWCETALQASRRLSRRVSEAGSAGNLALAYARGGQYRKVVELLEASLKIGRELDDSNLWAADTLNHLGFAYRHLGQYHKAIEYHQAALDVFSATNDREGQAGALSNLGTAYSALGQYHKAEGCHKEALRIIKDLGLTRQLGEALTNLGCDYLHLDRHDDARRFFEESLTLHREMGDQSGLASDLTNLANLYLYHQLEFHKAIELQTEALQIRRDQGDSFRAAQVLASLGNAYMALQQFDKAVGCNQEALEYFRESGYRKGEANSLNSLGLICMATGRYFDAIPYFDDSLVAKRELGDGEGEGNSLLAKATALDFLGRSDEALVCLNAAVNVWRALGLPKAEFAFQHFGLMQEAARAARQNPAAGTTGSRPGDHQTVEGAEAGNFGNRGSRRPANKEASRMKEGADMFSKMLLLSQLGEMYDYMQQSGWETRDQADAYVRNKMTEMGLFRREDLRIRFDQIKAEMGAPEMNIDDLCRVISRGTGAPIRMRGARKRWWEFWK